MSTKHTIRPGECIASVSLAFGFAPDTVWNDAGNEELRALRASGYHLVPGDVLVVPGRRDGSVSVQTDHHHVFRRRGVPEKLRIQVLDDDDAQASIPYVLVLDGETREGSTDADGFVDEWIPPGARFGRLTVGDEPPITLELGSLQPATEPAGVRDRLVNLGFLAPEEASAEPEVVLALLKFQAHHRVPASGVADEATAAKLAEAHGS